MDLSIKKGDPLYHLTQAGINEACAPLLETIRASQCCIYGKVELAFRKAEAHAAHAGDVDVLREFAVICQRVMDGKVTK